MNLTLNNYNWSRDRWQVFLLSLAQALGMSGSSLIMTTTALTGTYLAKDSALATLPLAIQFVGMMCATIPASLFMGRVGRKVGFSLGWMIGIAASMTATYGIFQGSFWIFCLGSFGLGITNSFAQYLRFAATEIVHPERRPQAISYVMAGGVIAAFLGPWLATQTRDYFEPILFAGGFAALSGLYLSAFLISALVKFAPLVKHNGDHHDARPLSEIIRQPRFITALVAGTMGYGIMSFVMTATPLAMVACGLEFSDAAFVIQWHVLGMFAPSFFTGRLIQKFGALNIIFIGAVLNILCMVFALAGLEITHFWFALVALGVGWNFMFIGGSSLLTQCYRDSERSKVQAFNDFSVFSVVALASFSSGAIQDQLGWTWINYTIVPAMVLSMMAVIWIWLMDRRSSPPAAAE